MPENFRFHFVAHCSAAVAKFHCGVLELPPETTVAELRIGTSFLSPEQAERNLRELAATLEETAARTAASWEEKLAAIQVDADERTRRILYTCLHRTMLFPREFHEFDGSGNPVHYSPYSGTARPGVLYADNGFWDTHRTVYPLLSLLDPARYGEILSGWLNAAREGGWFPRWSSPGYRSCMTGTHIDAVYADAAVKGIGGFDLAEAWRYLLKNAYEPVEPHGLFGRRNLAEYIRYGFVPDDQCEHAASRTMDYAANDFCLAQIAGILGDAVHCDDLLRRSRNYRNLWNPAAGILQGRRADGTFSALSPTDWNRTYIEGSSWQCGFAVPHDPEGLIGLFGGPAATVARLDRMQEAPPDFQTGAYGKEIHEMAEMALAGFGQYAHSNQAGSPMCCGSTRWPGRAAKPPPRSAASRKNSIRPTPCRGMRTTARCPAGMCLHRWAFIPSAPAGRSMCSPRRSIRCGSGSATAGCWSLRPAPPERPARFPTPNCSPEEKSRNFTPDRA